MNKEIEEMANICEMIKNEWSSHKQGFCYAQAEALYNAGYRKTVWHKVADGDLPEKEKVVLCYTRCNDYVSGRLTHKKSQGDVWDLDNDMCYRKPRFVIAWTELPKYEGKE